MVGIYEGRNQLLDSLAPSERELLETEWTRVELRTGQVLHDANGEIPFCYFPESGVVSLLAILSNGQPAEIGMVGHEGMVGVPALLGSDHASSEAMVQIDGTSLRIRTDSLKRTFETSNQVRSAILRFVQAMSVQTSQIAVCNAQHDTQQRLARWLLMVDAHGSGEAMLMTQERLAATLGVRRQQVSLAAAALQSRGHISYGRGLIVVRDRVGLKSAACECFDIMAQEYEHLLGLPRRGFSPVVLNKLSHSATGGRV